MHYTSWRTFLRWFTIIIVSRIPSAGHTARQIVCRVTTVGVRETF